MPDYTLPDYQGRSLEAVKKLIRGREFGIVPINTYHKDDYLKQLQEVQEWIDQQRRTAGSRDTQAIIIDVKHERTLDYVRGWLVVGTNLRPYLARYAEEHSLRAFAHNTSDEFLIFRYDGAHWEATGEPSDTDVLSFPHLLDTLLGNNAKREYSFTVTFKTPNKKSFYSRSDELLFLG